jgi:diguanylate cyclase (GGDEF)-like protein
VRERLRNVFAKQDDPYAGVDLANAARFGGALWFLAAGLTALLLPLDPPDDAAIGDAGWAIAAALVAGSVAAGFWMRSLGSKAANDKLLLLSYAAIAEAAVLVWLSGGIGSPYQQLMLLSLVYTCALHPPRRALPYVATLAVLALLPLAYDDHVTRREAVDLVTEVLVWVGLAFVVMFLMAYVRAQRLGLRREGEDARRQARLDPLTGLLNRRAFDEDLAHSIGRARAGNAPLSVLVGDLDDFKDFNDRFGHLEGDRVLTAVGATLRGALRRPDVAYRWGGDEFAVILPQADLRGARLVADRVEAAVAQQRGPDGEQLGISTGIGELGHNGANDAASLVEVADQGLLRAKGSGTFEVPQAQG